MLSSIPVFIADYNSQWPVFAANYAAKLSAISPSVLKVHHIGSTAVPELAAKPILDLMPIVTNLAALDDLQPRMEVLGYQWHGAYGILGRRYCTLSDEAGIRLVQLHCFEENSPHIKRHLAFRDYLLAHPTVAKNYEKEKRRAAQLHPENSHAYSDEKGAWIRGAEMDALKWYSEKQS